MERLDAGWVVTSNDDTLSAEDVVLGSKRPRASRPGGAR
jgi:hypothetical protein